MYAATILAALTSGEWELRRLPRVSYLTDEANKRFAWSISRTQAPFCGEDGVRIWVGPSAFEVLKTAHAALNKKFKLAPEDKAIMYLRKLMKFQGYFVPEDDAVLFKSAANIMEGTEIRLQKS